MPTAQDVLWFKSQFQPAMEAALAGTPFSVDMLTAVACQETGEIWPALRRKGLPAARLLELCVGDTIDGSATGGRRAFPRNKAELVAAPNGERMFAIARQGLLDMAEQIAGYRGVAARPDKFCHGFGIFQLDLQFFLTEPEYFLERRYADFGAALERCLGELKAAARRIGLDGRAALSDLEMAAVAIAYNTGRFVPSRGLKQGYFDGTKYYGENFYDFLQLAKGVAFTAAAPAAVTRGAPVPAEVAAGTRTRAAAPAPAGAKTATKKPAKKKAAKKKTAAKRATKKTAGKTAKNATKNATKKATGKAVKTTRKTARKAAKKTARKTTRKIAAKATKKAAKKATKKAVKRS